MAKKAFFFFEEQKIDSDHEQLSGSQLKDLLEQAIQGFKRGDELIQEGQGNDPDVLIEDGSNVDLTHGKGQGPKRFFSRPPTNFG